MSHSILLSLVGMVFATSVAAASMEDSTKEVRSTFTLGGKLIPPVVFSDFGDDDLSDASRSIWVTVDLLAAVGSNLYAAPVVRSPQGWVWQKNGHRGAGASGEDIGYRYVGSTRNGLMLVVAALRTTGTGIFYTLHILDVSPARAFDDDDVPYDRLNLTVIRNLALGDRWRGDVKIDGDMVMVTTPPGEPNNGNTETKTLSFRAKRP